MKSLFFVFYIAVLMGCTTAAQEHKKSNKKQNKSFSVTKTDAQWKAELNTLQYHVLREEGTEPAGNNAYNKLYDSGVYLCAGCGVKLYESEHKYDSGSGWPAFDKGVEANLGYEKDVSFGMTRTEVHCNNCGGHLGHVFNDGPKHTTGLRHCINSAALNFKPVKK